MSFCFYEPGDIIIVRNQIFKDSKLCDIRLNGRPSLVIHTNETHFYYLTMSKRTDENNTPLKYYEIRKDYFNKLPLNRSFINLECIYKNENKSIIPKGRISKDQFKNLIKRFYYYQKVVKQDEFFDELVESGIIPVFK